MMKDGGFEDVMFFVAEKAVVRSYNVHNRQFPATKMKKLVHFRSSSSKM